MFKLKNVDQELIKDLNKKLIINLLQSQRELTKQQIANEIGVSIPTVISNVKEFIDEGILEEAGVGDSSGGRKPVIVRFKPDSRYTFGVDIDNYTARIILANLDCKIIKESKISIKGLSLIDNIADIKSFVKTLTVAIFDIIKEMNISKSEVLGVGISLPGTVNEEKLLLEWAPNFSMKNISFLELQNSLELPIYLENEANAAALAELKLGIATDMKNLIYISVTEGIGTGIVILDYLYKGTNKRAGEFGHMTIVKDGKRCNCGKKGCWEQYASENALLEEYNSKVIEPISSIKEFFALVHTKEKVALRTLDEYLDYLALGLQNIILIMDPHYIVLGGTLSNFEDYILELLKEKVFTPNSFFSSKDIKIYSSRLKGDSSLLGAALLPLQKIFYLDEKII